MTKFKYWKTRYQEYERSSFPLLKYYTKRINVYAAQFNINIHWKRFINKPLKEVKCLGYYTQYTMSIPRYAVAILRCAVAYEYTRTCCGYPWVCCVAMIRDTGGILGYAVAAGLSSQLCCGHRRVCCGSPRVLGYTAGIVECAVKTLGCAVVF